LGLVEVQKILIRVLVPGNQVRKVMEKLPGTYIH
jgi:hypothetical protein